jgi:hypothetical protein
MIHNRRDPRDTAINSSLMAAGTALLSSWGEGGFFTTLASILSLSLSLSLALTLKHVQTELNIELIFGDCFTDE